MTHKVTIELTEDQVEHFRDRDFLVLTEEQKAQILPKPQKKWRFYKGKFPEASALRAGYWSDFEKIGRAVIDISNTGPDAYCFTREQLINFAAYIGHAYLRWEGVEHHIDEYLSQQEEK